MSTNLEKKRFDKTGEFFARHIPKTAQVLDLGIESDMSRFLRSKNYDIKNTAGEDLDVNFEAVKKFRYITAFEIFEHMFAPFNLLNAASGKLVATVPLNVWFSPAYWNNQDKRDCHYHEFEPRQFRRLLERTGWEIIADEQWTISGLNGVRPMLRTIFPSYYAVCAVK